MVRFCPTEGFHVYRSLLATGAVLFNRADFKSKALQFDDKSRWLLGDGGAARFAAIPAQSSNLPVRRAFPEGGYYLLGSDFETDREVRIVADVGPLGYLSIAAHGHADALSFTLSAAGETLLIDPGTYTYQGDIRWREYFRGTAAHNTLRIDEENQSLSGGSFMWMRHAQATCEGFEVSGESQMLSASHDGYTRLAAPATHRRTWTYNPSARLLSIEDEVISTSSHLVEVHWHFCDQCMIEVLEDHAVVRKNGVVLTLRWSANSVVKTVRGQENPPMGWVSPRFDSKKPSGTIVARQRIHGNWRGVTEIEIVSLGEMGAKH
jgi:hypothetical protein